MGEAAIEPGERPAPRVLTPEELPGAIEMITSWVSWLKLDEEVDSLGVRGRLQDDIILNCFDDVEAAFLGLDDLHESGEDPGVIQQKTDELREIFRSRLTPVQAG